MLAGGCAEDGKTTVDLTLNVGDLEINGFVDDTRFGRLLSMKRVGFVDDTAFGHPPVHEKGGFCG